MVQDLTPQLSGPALSGPALSGPALSSPALSGRVLSGPALAGPVLSGPALSDLQIDTAPVVSWGEAGPTLVFLHYFGGAASSWRWVAEQLSADYRCIAINLPGFGQAPPLEHPSLQRYAQFVAHRIQTLNLQKYSLVGHSMGAKVALKLAALKLAALKPTENPGAEIEQIFLVAPSPATREPMPQEEKERLLNHHPERENAETTVDKATRRTITAEQRSLAIQTHMTAENSAWRWWLLEGMDESMAEQAKTLRMPVTVIASQDDPVIDFEQVQSDVVDLLPRAELVSLAGVGHLVPLEEPEAIAQAIRQRLKAKG